VNKHSLSSGSSIVAITLTVIFLLWILCCRDVLSDQIDTLDLQFQWSYPVSGIATYWLYPEPMKLADLDQDGINEILIGFNSDSVRVGIIDVVDGTMTCQSSGLPNPVISVGAGDRNADGLLDIVAGGAGGYLWVIDAPDFDSVLTITGLDQDVEAVGIYCLDSADGSKVFAGTFRHYMRDVSTPPHHAYEYFWVGNIVEYDGMSLALLDLLGIGAVTRLGVFDLDDDGIKELILGEISCFAYCGWGGNDEIHRVLVRLFSPQDTTATVLFSADLDCGHMMFDYVRFDALAIGDCDGDGRTEIISAYRVADYPTVTCLDGLTGEVEWEDTDTDYAGPITGLALCDLAGWPSKVVCAAYQNGEIRFKSGPDGADVALVHSLPKIDYFGVGNMDHDGLVEICIVSAAADTVYIYEAPFLFTDVEEAGDKGRPSEFSLFQNYPNPFNPETNIRFAIPFSSEITLRIYNILGEQVQTLRKQCSPGTHTLIWDGRSSSDEDVASGVYLYRLTAGDYQETKKMVLLR